MSTLVLPSMVAGRALANTLVDRVATDLASAEVVLDCRRLVSGSPSFAAQLVKRVLVDGHARALRVDGGPAAFVGYLEDAAARLGVSDRLRVSDRHTGTPQPA